MRKLGAVKINAQRSASRPRNGIDVTQTRLGSSYATSEGSELNANRPERARAEGPRVGGRPFRGGLSRARDIFIS